MSNWLIECSTALLDRGTTRSGFLTETVLVGLALAVAPVAYILAPRLPAPRSVPVVERAATARTCAVTGLLNSTAR